MKAINSIGNGLTYLTRGAAILTKPGIKRYVLVPITANIIVFLLLTTALISSYGSLNQWLANLLSSDWSWLQWILNIVAVFISAIIILLILIAYGVSFNLITNFIAAPFYGLLAEKVEKQMHDVEFPEESFGHMAIRTLGRELTKLWYFISRGIPIVLGLFLLSFIPIVNLIAPILGILWGVWMMTLQYADYSADNHQLSFTQLRQSLKKNKYTNLGFGGGIMLASTIPLVNILIMPAAVAGGTVYWVEVISQETEPE